jgi:hypothetical protein
MGRSRSNQFEGLLWASPCCSHAFFYCRSAPSQNEGIAVSNFRRTRASRSASAASIRLFRGFGCTASCWRMLPHTQPGRHRYTRSIILYCNRFDQTWPVTAEDREKLAQILDGLERRSEQIAAGKCADQIHPVRRVPAHWMDGSRVDCIPSRPWCLGAHDTLQPTKAASRIGSWPTMYFATFLRARICHPA